MPNWCYNELNMCIKDSAKDRGIEVLQAFTRNNPFNAVLPNPSGEWNYDWSCQNWGTKWDVDVYVNTDLKLFGDTWVVSVTFDSAWSPPEQLYRYISEQYPDIELDAYWEEPGCGQKGTFDANEGMFSSTIEDYVWETEDEVFDMPDTAATPNVGAATVLPLPGGNNK